MALYFDTKLHLEHDVSQVTDIQWHNTAPVLAVAFFNERTGGFVNVFNEDGDVEKAFLQKAVTVTALHWHPIRKLLAVGWEKGEVCVWNPQEVLSEVGNSPHKNEITAVCWTSNGSRLLTTDRNGTICVWKVDAKGAIHQLALCNITAKQPALQAILLKQPQSQNPEIAALARAAVSGDEKALDLFQWKKQGSSGPNAMKSGISTLSQESLSFVIGCKNGEVLLLNEACKLQPLFNVEGDVKKLLYHSDRRLLITLTDKLFLVQHEVRKDGSVEEVSNVKLSGRADESDLSWATRNILVIITRENYIRLMDLELEDSYLLTLDPAAGYDRSDKVMCCAYSPSKGILAAGTEAGQVALWRYDAMAFSSRSPELSWKLQRAIVLPGPVTQLTWSSKRDFLAANLVGEARLLSEQVMSSHCYQRRAAVQTGPSLVSITCFDPPEGEETTVGQLNDFVQYDLKTDIHVKGICIANEFLAIWNGKQVVVYSYTHDPSSPRALGSFMTSSTALALHEQTAFMVEDNRVQARTHKGTVRQLLNFSDHEGEPVVLDVNGDFLAVASSSGVVKVFNLSRSLDAKQVQGSPKNVSQHVKAFGGFATVRVNCKGKAVSFTTRRTDGSLDTNLYVWLIENDHIRSFDFSTGYSDSHETSMANPRVDSKSRQPTGRVRAGAQLVKQTQDLKPQPKMNELSDLEKLARQLAEETSGRYPAQHYWDTSGDPRLIVCELHPVLDGQRLRSPTKKNENEVKIVSLFATPNHGLCIHDVTMMDPSFSKLLALHVPYIYYLRKLDIEGGSSSLMDEVKAEEEQEKAKSAKLFGNSPDEDEGEEDPNKKKSVALSTMVAQTTMSNFQSLDGIDHNVRIAVLEFSFNLAIGNLDEAFKAIKLIKSESVWGSMARLCVKTRRLDVAAVCLGNMKNARASRALRMASKYAADDLDARVAVLAIYLGMNEDAVRLLKISNRYDLLSKLYQGCGNWTEALKIAETNDQVHVTTTYRNYAKFLEKEGDVKQAAGMYTKAKTEDVDVPRMLLENPVELENYVAKTQKNGVKKWYAQYLETLGDIDRAALWYEKAEDKRSMVRLACNANNGQRAKEICDESNDPSANFHFAYWLESNNQSLKDAVAYFTKAGAYGTAIRVCKEHDFDDLLVQTALQATDPEILLDAASYLENRPNYTDKAVLLYHRAGRVTKATELAFRSRQFSALHFVTADMDKSSNLDPELMKRSAEFMLENKQWDRAVDLLAASKQWQETLALCHQYNVPMTEHLMEKLTPEKDAPERMHVLEGLAELCMHQSEYHLASKAYTQAGNKIQAMKSLLKSGDTDKIIFYANVCRQKETYIMAANYLQTCDWRANGDVMKTIMTFYNKGQRPDLLANFYDACAQVEIDDYQNYDKAYNALGEAAKCLQKAADNAQPLPGVEQKLADVGERMQIVKRFCAIKQQYESSPDQAVKECVVLLQQTSSIDLDSAVRLGDIYGLMVDFFVRQGNAKRAFACIEELKARMPSINLSLYIEPAVLVQIGNAVGVDLGQRAAVSQRNVDDDDEVAAIDD